jgi:hypothetical protein
MNGSAVLATSTISPYFNDSTKSEFFVTVNITTVGSQTLSFQYGGDASNTPSVLNVPIVVN